ncbi:hypothetical protein CTAYLR_007567 [Chrysophaeum taylorii]|uniref:MgtC/SapB/SrpB/YhiD N-terminal domain-containing protein n=1 Tax=Chrysophaeum taylorii TaxID=2483200 RepID=A0AAD7XM80_9STRA|nr:hypothetical protein CTAYLR_007567 [Chrysophaeum taylorii]
MIDLVHRKSSGMRSLFQSHFSSEATVQVRVAYLVICCVVGAYTAVVLLEGLIDTCAYPRNRSGEDDGIAYTNPEYSTLGRCLQSRYAFLMGLTPQECSLCRRILMSVILGMMIGFERRRPDRPAGVRTMSLVSLGSCIFTIDSMFAFSSSPDNWDSSRVAAAIPSGVGFLGAGLIYKQAPRRDQDRHEVHGLTTASSVWLSAAAGIAAGGGLMVISMFSTMVMIVVLRFGPRLPLDDAESNSQRSSDADDEELQKFVYEDTPKQRRATISDEKSKLVDSANEKAASAAAYNALSCATSPTNISRKPSLRE